jgi:hypothetical protein
MLSSKIQNSAPLNSSSINSNRQKCQGYLESRLRWIRCNFLQIKTSKAAPKSYTFTMSTLPKTWMICKILQKSLYLNNKNISRKLIGLQENSKAAAPTKYTTIYSSKWAMSSLEMNMREGRYLYRSQTKTMNQIQLALYVANLCLHLLERNMAWLVSRT